MPWGTLNTELTGRVTDVLELRRAHAALARGGRKPLYADDETALMLKTHAEGNVLVGINVSESPRSLTLENLGLGAEDLTFTPLLGADAPVVDESGAFVWLLPPLTTSYVSIADRDSVLHTGTD